MFCTSCNTETFGVHESNTMWCENCGHALNNATDYVVGYCQSHSCRNQVYSRVKRFGKYFKMVCHDISVLQRYNDVLDLYSCFEFVWIHYKGQSKRTYFFAKPVMLRLCCDILNIESNQIPSLKDKMREREQITELMALCNSRIWKALYGRRKFGGVGLLHAAV